MLSENIKSLRKDRGMSQEELAEKLNVVRQTVSKWEQNLSVPDSEMLIKIAEVFEVSVSSLLGETVEIKDTKSELAEISQKLENLNAMMAEKNARSRRFWMTAAATVLILIAVVMIFFTGLMIAKLIFFVNQTESLGIIGGADGPTQIIVSSGTGTGSGCLAAILTLSVSLVLIAFGIYLIKKARINKF